MSATLKKVIAAAATSVVVLAGAACSSTVDGKGSREDSGGSSVSSAPSSESMESDPSGSEPDPAPGEEVATDGSFTYSMPAGWEDGAGQLDTALDPLAAMVDPSTSTSSVVTFIAVNSEPTQGASLEQIAEVAQEIISKKFNTTTEVGNPDITSVDGEDFIAFTVAGYDDGGNKVATAQIITIHDDVVYYFTANCAPGDKSNAGGALMDVVESVQWA